MAFQNPIPISQDFDAMLITVAKEAARLDDVCTVITAVYLQKPDGSNSHPFRVIAPHLSATV
jgi:hypothetical protein